MFVRRGEVKDPNNEIDKYRKTKIANGVKRRGKQDGHYQSYVSIITTEFVSLKIRARRRTRARNATCSRVRLSFRRSRTQLYGFKKDFFLHFILFVTTRVRLPGFIAVSRALPRLFPKRVFEKTRTENLRLLGGQPVLVPSDGARERAFKWVSSAPGSDYSGASRNRLKNERFQCVRQISEQNMRKK